MKRAAKLGSYAFRLVAAIPPLGASLFASDLSFSLQLAGAAGIYVAFVAPALLQIKGMQMVKEALFKDDSSSSDRRLYSGWYSNPNFAFPVLLFAAFSFTLVLVHIRDSWIANE
jgi:hypothetical protein